MSKTWYGGAESLDLWWDGDGWPEVGDELCDGHQIHYDWDGISWGRGPTYTIPGVVDKHEYHAHPNPFTDGEECGVCCEHRES